MVIPPRHLRALEMLRERRHLAGLGEIGRGALRDEDDVLTLEQIVEPLEQRGLIEDLTQTDLGDGGKYFVRITPLGSMCLALGYMLRETRKTTNEEMKLIAAALPEPMIMTAPPTATQRVRYVNPYDPNEEKEAIA
jgi:hypothetical protein